MVKLVADHVPENTEDNQQIGFVAEI